MLKIVVSKVITVFLLQVGNSGMFRPEMLRPMGMPEDVNVIAWGLSLERPTMILYGIDNIRDLFGHKVGETGVKSWARLVSYIIDLDIAV
jgi:phenylalanyl-tRNA synthetase alpha subunit